MILKRVALGPNAKMLVAFLVGAATSALILKFPGETKTEDRLPETNIEAPRKPDRPGKTARRPANSGDFPSVSSVLDRKGELSGDEFGTELRKACAHLQNASAEEIQEALLQLPPGEDSFGAFNDLSFYLFARDPQGAIAFFQDQIKDGIFPEGWVSSAANSGIGALALTDPLEAIRQSLAARDIFPANLARAKLVSTAIGTAPDSSSNEVFKAIGRIDDKELLAYLVERGEAWKVASKTGNVQELVNNLSRRGIPMSGEAKKSLALAVSDRGDFPSGFKIVKDATQGDGAAVSAFIGKWLAKDTNQALQGIGELDQKTKDLAIAGNISEISKWDHPSAVKWAESIQDESLRKTALGKLK